MKGSRIARALAVGFVMFFLLVILPQHMDTFMNKVLPYASLSSVIPYFFNGYTLSLGAIISVLSALGIAFKRGKAGGTVKSLQGVAGMFYFIYLLHFGKITLNLTVYGMPVTLELAVTIGLLMIEFALLLSVIEGIMIVAGHS